MERHQLYAIGFFRLILLFEQITQLPEYYPTRTETWILERCAAEIAERGYTILEGAIEEDLLAELDETLLRLEKDLGAVPAGKIGRAHV